MEFRGSEEGHDTFANLYVYARGDCSRFPIRVQHNYCAPIVPSQYAESAIFSMAHDNFVQSAENYDQPALHVGWIIRGATTDLEDFTLMPKKDPVKITQQCIFNDIIVVLLL